MASCRCAGAERSSALLPGCAYALCASSFFRARHGLVPVYKTGRRKELRRSNYAERCEMARDYIRLARAAGFRGTFLQAAEQWRNHQDAAVMAREGGALARSEPR
jgi:hypothetical protein